MKYYIWMLADGQFVASRNKDHHGNMFTRRTASAEAERMNLLYKRIGRSARFIVRAVKLPTNGNKSKNSATVGGLSY